METLCGQVSATDRQTDLDNVNPCIRTCHSILIALQTLSRTLDAMQAYGARDYKALGDVPQRALLVCWTACVPVALLWSQSEALMVAVGQDPAIAALAAR